jgi:hypothetical protein
MSQDWKHREVTFETMLIFLPTDRYQRVFLVYHSAIFRCMWVWFVGAQTFGEKFLAGDLPYYLKSEPIPDKVSRSVLFL